MKVTPYKRQPTLKSVTLKRNHVFYFEDVSIFVAAGTKMRASWDKSKFGPTTMWIVKTRLPYLISQEEILTQPDVFDFSF